MDGRDDFTAQGSNSQGIANQRPGVLQIAIRDLQTRYQEQQKRIVNLEQQVANQAVIVQRLSNRSDDTALKSQAAATQATEHLYAPLRSDTKPLRSDTKPLLEMSAFVRKVAWVDFRVLGDGELVREFIDTIIEAREILKRST